MQRATAPIAEALPPLLEKNGLSVNALAELVGVKQSHLSRALRDMDGKRVSGELASQIAVMLDLPPDYFPETRLAHLTELLNADGKLADSLYDRHVAP
jgi:transcriptional regulator with XRE-family HTH domain